MFSKPKGTSYVAPAEAIDVNEKYLVKLAEIKDEGVSKFADPADADPPHNLRWVFRMAHLDRTPILDIDGNPFEHHDYTSNRTGKSKTKTAKARLWAEALMGRQIEDNEIDDSLPNVLREKVATCIFEELERETESGDTYMKLKILKLIPYRTSQQVKEETLALGASSRMAGAAAAANTRAGGKPVTAGADIPW